MVHKKINPEEVDAKIAAYELPPDQLSAIDTPANGEAPTYNAATGKFEWKTAAGVTKLSDLTIDVSKDWAGKLIKNLGAPVAAGDAYSKGNAIALADIHPNVPSLDSLGKLILTQVGTKVGDLAVLWTKATKIAYADLNIANSVLVSDILSTEFNVANKFLKLDASALVPQAQIPDLPASKITSLRFPMDRMPDGTDGYVLTAKGAGVSPAYGAAPAPSANEILKALQNLDGVFWFNAHWVPEGMLSTGTTSTASISWATHQVTLSTGTTSGSIAYAMKSVNQYVLPSTWGKKRHFCVKLSISTTSALISHIISGYVTNYAASGNIRRHIGFKVINNVLYGTVADGTTESTLEIETLPDGIMTIEVVLTVGVEARFYVDGVDKGAITTNLPTGTTDAHYPLHASISNTENVNKLLSVCEVRFLQEE